jgi:beta-glucosidase
MLGYSVGVHAPGRRDEAAAIAAAHHVLLSHGLAVDAIRGASTADVGIVIDSWPMHPATGDERDVAAARIADGLRSRLFFEPVLLGRYPDDIVALLGDAAPPVRDGDLAQISAPIDFVGVNNYSRQLVRHDPDGGRPIVETAPGGDRTATGWEVYPEGLYEVLARVHHEYGAPSLYVTENGAAYADVRGHDGSVRDPERIDYLERYLAEVARAIADGIPVNGYFVWSFLDNFEWASGYSKRFGIVYVDYPTLERVPKSSFYWYRDLIAQCALRRGSERAA